MKNLFVLLIFLPVFAYADAKLGTWRDGLLEYERADSNIGTATNMGECKTKAEAYAKEYGKTRTTGHTYVMCQVVLRVDFVKPPVVPPVVIPDRKATISWVPPTLKTDGTPLDNLKSYAIYYSKDQNKLTETVPEISVGKTTYVIEPLDPGTWYFSVSAWNTDGQESPKSPPVSKTIK